MFLHYSVSQAKPEVNMYFHYL